MIFDRIIESSYLNKISDNLSWKGNLRNLLYLDEHDNIYKSPNLGRKRLRGYHIDEKSNEKDNIKNKNSGERKSRLFDSNEIEIPPINPFITEEEKRKEIVIKWLIF